MSKVEQARAARLKQVPALYQGAYAASVSSRSAAVTAFCQECCGYDRDTIRQCTALACPLWHWRPYQPEEKASGPKRPISPKALEGLKRYQESQRNKEKEPDGL